MFTLQLAVYTCQIGYIQPAGLLAYLDPGTGSIILQALIGILFGSLFCVKLFWVRIQSVSAKLLGRGDQRDQRGE